MKKRILIFIAVLIAAVALFGVACTNTEDKSGDPQYDSLNRMLQGDYTALRFTVTTENEGITLESTFDIRYKGIVTEINYSVQRMRELSLGNASDRIETLTGSATVRNGAITDINGDGDTAVIDFEKLATVGLDFRAQYFSDEQWTDGSFSAKVIDPKAFIGSDDLTCSDMEVHADFLEVYEKITITYVTAPSVKVRYCYEFVK